MNCLRILLIAACLSACASSTQQAASTDADRKLQSLYEREWDWRQQQRAQVRDKDGDWAPAGHLPDVSPAAYQARLQYWEQVLEELDDIPRQALSHEEQVNAAVFEQIVTTDASDAGYRTYEAPLNSDTFFWGGLHPQQAGFDDLAGYERYVGRLRDIPRYFAQHQRNMQAGLARGYSPPAVTLAGRDASIEAYIATGRGNPFAGPLNHFPPTMDASERSRIEAEVLAAIDDQVVPAYVGLLGFMRETYLPGARTSLAARELPDGEAFYQSQIRGFTTLELGPEELHRRADHRLTPSRA